MPESRDRLVRGSSITPIFSRRSERGYWIDTDQETGIGNGRRNLMGSPTQFGGSTVIIGRRGSLIRSPLGLYGSNRSVGGQENRSLVVNGRRGGGSRIRGRNSVLPSWYPRRPLQDITAISAKRKLSDMLGSQWSKDKLERFYEAYRKYGKDWKKVASVVRNRTIEMVEALYNMNRAYLSLPEGTASVAGLIAMMTDHYNIMVFGALIIAKLLSVPLVMSYHTHVPIYLPSYSFSWMVKPMWMIIKFLHRAADLTLVPSAAIGRDLEAARVTEANKIRLWSKGVDSEKFHPRFRNKEMRIRLCNGEPEKPLLIHVGRLGAEKSLDFLKTSTLMLDNLYFSEC